MILENGAIRTLDPALPLARSLAIAGELVAGGVSAHETALPGPERIDLGGRCVVPGFTGSRRFGSTASAVLRRTASETARNSSTSGSPFMNRFSSHSS